MEQNSQTNMEKINILEAQIRECFGRVVYSHKTQEKCADFLFSLNKKLKLTQIILSAIITTSLFVEIFGDNKVTLYIAAVMSTILLIFNTYLKNYNLGSMAQNHSNTANELWNIRESYLSLLADINSTAISTNQIINRRDEIQTELFRIYSSTPRTDSKSYKKASKALKINEELTFSDEEIDVFLPKELRKIKNKK